MIRYKKIETDTYGILQLYFYDNLFSPSFESSIINDEKLAKITVCKVLNDNYLN